MRLLHRLHRCATYVWRVARVAVVGAVVAVAVTSAPTRAQTIGPEGADRWTVEMARDSLRAFNALTDRVRRDQRNAELWYARGMLAWGLYDRARRLPPVPGLSWPILVHAVDTSFQRALRLDPENATYFVAAARFAIASNLAFRPGATSNLLDESIERARAAGDLGALADALVARASDRAVKYESDVCRAYQLIVTMATTGALVYLPPLEGFDGYPQFTQSLDYMGEMAYLHAEANLREALSVRPGHEPAVRALAALLADQMRWNDLARLARGVVEQDSTHAWGWLALGLASHRRADPAAADDAMARGLRHLNREDRERLFRIDRVLPPDQRARWAAADAARRHVIEQDYWRTVQPLWSRRETDVRLEFQARIIFAELRWTQPDLGLNGVLHDAGRRYVGTGRRVPNSCGFRREAWYVWNDTTVPNHRGANWANVIGGVVIDTIPTQVARFRAANGLTDVVFVSAPPVQRLLDDIGVRTTARTDFWLTDQDLVTLVRDSVTPASGTPFLRTVRVPPGGYIFRTEASADGGLRAARATGGVLVTGEARTGFTFSGPGMSDLLFTDNDGDTRGAARWTDVDIQPRAGALPHGSSLGMLWESYELTERDGQARYTITVELSRQVTRGPVPGDIRVTIAGARAQRRPDRSTFTFERTVPHHDVVVDHLAVALGTTPPGDYTVTVRITDRNAPRGSPAVHGRTQRITIAPPPPTLRR